MRDALTHGPSNGILLCKTCHDWVHAHPLEARRFGWIVSRSTGDPGIVPVKAHFGWVLLDVTGSFDYADAPFTQEG